MDHCCRRHGLRQSSYAQWLKKDERMPAIQFHTQRPREDGCGAVTVQMLTGKGHDEVLPLFGWGPEDLRRTDWTNLQQVLTTLGWQMSEITPVSSWDQISDLAVEAASSTIPGNGKGRSRPQAACP
jgi:hypothetical protein